MKEAVEGESAHLQILPEAAQRRETKDWCCSATCWGKNLLISNGLNHSLPALLHLLLLLSLQSCLTLCDPVDGSPPGSPGPGILQAGVLKWVAISFFNA